MTGFRFELRTPQSIPQPPPGQKTLFMDNKGRFAAKRGDGFVEFIWPQVFFHAAASIEAEITNNPFGAELYNKLHYSTVLSNPFNTYNPLTGIWTCPVDADFKVNLVFHVIETIGVRVRYGIVRLRGTTFALLALSLIHI